MKIALIGPGIMPIPTTGWGAVEILIWDYYRILTNKGHTVDIINKIRTSPIEQMNVQSKYCQELIHTVNQENYDFVHVHYDCLFHLIPFFTCKKIGFTSHYPYINQPSKHRADNFSAIYKFMLHNDKYTHFVLAKHDIEFLISQGVNSEYVCPLENGIKIDDMHFDFIPAKKTIYLGKITSRKKQHIYCKLNPIDIIGPNDSSISLQNYKGSWSRIQVYQELTKYGNLLLISSGEADPLVVKEALSAGLGVVINSECAKNLSPQPFITILDDDKLDDLSYVQTKINDNLHTSAQMRQQIRDYAIQQFSWDCLIDKYLSYLQ